MPIRLRGLVAATHTPFDDQGNLNLPAVEAQAEHLVRDGVGAVFIGGTTGESSSLTTEERRLLAERWGAVARGSALRVVVHVGSNSISDSRALAAHAETTGATAIAALAPSYFKPRDVDALIACCAEIAGAAPALPFYFYDIPSMTGVQLSMPEFLERAPAKAPTLAGLKFTNIDLMAFQECLAAGDGRFDVLWGVDEALLAALALGAEGAVGSSYNFAAPLYHRVIAAYQSGDLKTARLEQLRAVRLIKLLSSFGYMASAKAVMGLLGVDVGPPRLPTMRLIPEQAAELKAGLDRLDFFESIRG
ncbi:dihydrodipicolinate synthase family protein [Planctomyces sp. SH-PL62]|uniref:dihydrodipicolinate synthase family protein n=1 Tax=Planctomyces sp. SH-PL62 TaxID=1636152 RepID=UPI00078D0A01|nr:dihydrodipicolinate synthase family protein [Planctomyces sp. SH-PL62]AMV39074.1 N-acetylneuraminate lyase [Planctomyces sp. SH-PL62]